MGGGQSSITANHSPAIAARVPSGVNFFSKSNSGIQVVFPTAYMEKGANHSRPQGNTPLARVAGKLVGAMSRKMGCLKLSSNPDKREVPAHNITSSPAAGLCFDPP